jgi:signal recognition particle subunit SRP54
MGDIMSLIEQAEQTMDRAEAERAAERMGKGEFNLEDFLSQMQQLKKMGPLNKLIEMIPGMNQLTKQLPQGIDEKSLKRVEAIIYSMTVQERRNPKILNGSRKRRVAAGSGTTVQEINQLVRQFLEMQKMMKSFSRGKRIPKGMMDMFR